MAFTRASFLYNQLYYRYNTVRNIHNGIFHKFKIFTKKKFIYCNKILNYIEIFPDENISNFFYSIDENKIAVANKIIYDNLTPDYTILLNYALKDIINDNKDIIGKLLENYFKRVLKTVNPEQAQALNKLYTEPCEGFKDALQRILFVNQLIWQEGHKLVGLGHLDWILESYYQHDIDTGVITKDKAFNLIKEFLLILHKHYEYKSSSLLGDTGQVIILGGLTSPETYKTNELSYMFIEAIQDLHLPDPKVLVRVSRKMPKDLLEKSVECISTGIGCPLFANDDVIIPILKDFGYPENDCYNYGTSACWEPFITGKSVDANNIFQINFLQPLINVFARKDIKSIHNYEELLSEYKSELKTYALQALDIVSKFKWEAYPILSMFIQKNDSNRPVYSDLGFTTVALSNTVNSLLNIKKIIYEKSVFSLSDLKNYILKDFNGNEKICALLKNNADYYGADNVSAVELANEIFVYISDIFAKNESLLGEKKLKLGASSPSYISLSKTFSATPDGRKKGEPFNVHISNEKTKDLTSLFSFAAQLNYQNNRFNGNVIDFMVTPSFIKSNFAQFTDMLFASFMQGIFEMQINVLDSKTLIAAKKNPKNFPNLIVRVWGFSAYFNDLPDSYKDVLIERALENERSNN